MEIQLYNISNNVKQGAEVTMVGVVEADKDEVMCITDISNGIEALPIIVNNSVIVPFSGKMDFIYDGAPTLMEWDSVDSSNNRSLPSVATVENAPAYTLNNGLTDSTTLRVSANLAQDGVAVTTATPMWGDIVPGGVAWTLLNNILSLFP